MISVSIDATHNHALRQTVMQARQNYLKEDRVTSCDKEILPSDKYKRDDQVEITIFFLMVIPLSKSLSVLYPSDTLDG